MEFNQKLFISSQVELAITGDDVLVKTPFKIFRLSGNNVKTELIPALPYLDAGTTVHELMQKIVIEDKDEFIAEILSPMINRNWLSFDDQLVDDPKLMNRNAFTSLGTDGTRMETYLESKSIAVIGLSKFSSEIATALQHYFQNVSLYVPTSTSSNVAMKHFEYELNDLDALFAELKQYDLVIFTESKENKHFESKINQTAVRHGVRVLYSEMSGFNLSVGPTVIPYQTGCLECLQFRKMNNNSHSKDIMVFNKETTFGNAPSDGDSVDASTASMLKSMVALEAMRILMLDDVLYKDDITLEMAETLNTVINFNSFTNTLNTDSFLKNPRCSVCGEKLYLNPEIKPWMRDYTYPSRTEEQSE